MPSSEALGATRSVLDRLAGVTLFLVVALACAAATPPPATKPDLVGFISSVAAGTGPALGQIQVESHADKLVQRWQVAIDRGTVLQRGTDRDIQPIAFQDVQPKAWVRVWISERKLRPGVPIAARVIVSERP